MKKDILSLTEEEVLEYFEENGIPKYRGMQTFKEIHGHLKTKISEALLLPETLRDKLESEFEIRNLSLIHSKKSGLTPTIKFLFNVNGVKTIPVESVFMKEKNRVTYCISSQSGCNAGCTFCATGYLGLMKNLTPGEIVSQVYEIIKITGEPPTNIVFMGMGEPFLNFSSVIKALKILTSDNGLGLSSKKMTVSTIGIKGKIREFAEEISKPGNENIRNTKLAISLHSTRDKLREQLIPLSLYYNLATLKEDLVYFYSLTKTKITYEYIHFPDLNDRPEDIKKLAKIFRMLPSNINIIPFHPIENFRGSGNEIDKYIMVKNNSLFKEKLNYFIAELKKNGIAVSVRSSNGLDINAACGQLAANYKPK